LRHSPEAAKLAATILSIQNTSTSSCPDYVLSGVTADKEKPKDELLCNADYSSNGKVEAAVRYSVYKPQPPATLPQVTIDGFGY